MVLEKDDFAGGSWSRRYECLKLHTIRRYSGLPLYPIPKTYPKYLSKDEYVGYLRQYISFVGINVVYGEQVTSIRRSFDDAGHAVWAVKTNSCMRIANAVVIATGHYSKPFLPQLEGINRFRGELIHSSEFKNGSDYRSKRVLVIGLGNSGAEVSTDLVLKGAASVSLSVRTVPPIVTRELFGIVPVQVFGIFLMNLGIPTVIDRIGATLRRISIGDLSDYGLGDAKWGPFTERKPAVIDSSGFIAQLKNGYIRIRPQVKSFDSSHVYYVDGCKESIDVVIAATGFRTGLEKILKVPGMLDEKGETLFRSGSETSEPGLYFMGFDETIRGHLFEINRESILLAKEIGRYLGGY